MPTTATSRSKKKRVRTGVSRSPTPEQKRHAQTIYTRLRKAFPDATCALTHRDPFELLMATILSAQCTDVRVNMVTPDLFRKYPDPKAMANAELSDLENLIRTTGFFRNKAKSLKHASTTIHSEHRGRVPKTMDELTRLPGVARKTANVVLGNAFGKNEGVVVDTHVSRLSQRMGLSKHKDPIRIERDLMTLFTRASWTLLSHLLIFHGRQVCQARKPHCDDCALADICPKVGVPKTSRRAD